MANREFRSLLNRTIASKMRLENAKAEYAHYMSMLKHQIDAMSDKQSDIDSMIYAYLLTDNASKSESGIEE